MERTRTENKTHQAKAKRKRKTQREENEHRQQLAASFERLPKICFSAENVRELRVEVSKQVSYLGEQNHNHAESIDQVIMTGMHTENRGRDF